MKLNKKVQAGLLAGAMVAYSDAGKVVVKENLERRKGE